MNGAFAADRYWVGGSGNWNDTGHWSAASGGTGGVAVPTINDDVYFDDNSELGDGTTVTLNVAGNCRSMTWTGMGEVTFAKTSTLTVAGSLTLRRNMITTGNGTISFTGAGVNTVTSNGVAITGSLNFSNASNPLGSWTFRDSLVVAATITFTNGNLNFNGQYVSMTTFTSTGNNARVLNIAGSTVDVGTWNHSSGSTALSAVLSAGSFVRVTTGFTGRAIDTYNVVEAGTGTLSVGNFNKIVMNKGSGTLNAAATGSINVDILEFAALGGFAIFGGSTVNVTETLTKTTGELSTLKSTTTTQAVINMGDPSTVSVNATGLQNIKITGPGADYPTSGGYNMGGNAGWDFQDVIPADMNTYFWRGGARDNLFNNVNNWELGYPGSGALPSNIFGTGNDICFPPDVNNPAAMTLTTSVGMVFRNLDYRAAQSITINGNNKSITASNISVNNGTLTINGVATTSYPLTVTDNMKVGAGGTFVLSGNNGAASFGETVVDGKFTHTTGGGGRITFNGNATINPGGLYTFSGTGNTGASEVYMKDLIIRAGGKMITEKTGAHYAYDTDPNVLHFYGSLVDPGHGIVSAYKTEFVFYTTPDVIDLPLYPGFRESTLNFNSPQGYEMQGDFYYPSGAVKMGANLNGFKSNGYNITCDKFHLVSQPAVSGNVVNLEGSAITLQRLVNNASAVVSRLWDVQASNTDLIFNHSTEHRVEYVQNLTFGSATFTGSAPAAKFYTGNYALSGAVFSVDKLISDVGKITLDGSVDASNGRRPLTVKVTDRLTLLRSCDIYAQSNSIPTTYTLSVDAITEPGDACDTKSKIFSDGDSKLVFNSLSLIGVNNTAFSGITFTGSQLSAPRYNDLGGNSGNVDWTNSFASGATFYWVGGNGNWGDAENWSATSGGSGGTACLPSAGDNVVFDCNSFTAPGQTVTIIGIIPVVHDITWDIGLAACNKKGNLAGNTLFITGSADFRGCAEVSVPLNFSSNGDDNFIAAGASFTGAIRFDHDGAYTIVGPLLTTSDIFHRAGTIVCRDSISCRMFDSRLESADATARRIDFENARLTATNASSDNIYLQTDNLDLTGSKFAGSRLYSLNGGTFRIYSTVNVEQTVILGDLTAAGYVSVTYGNNAQATNVTTVFDNVYLKPNNATEKQFSQFTCANLFLKGGGNYKLIQTRGITVNGNFTTDAVSCSPITTITGNSANTAFYVKNLPFGIDNATIKNINATGVKLSVATCTGCTGNNNVDTGGTPAPHDYYWVGGNGSWDDPSHWSPSVSGGDPSVTNPSNCLPGRYDNIFFDENSFTATGQIVSLNVATVNCNNLIWKDGSGYYKPSLALSAGAGNIYVYGSLELIQGLTIYRVSGSNISIRMLGTMQQPNAQYIKFKGYNPVWAGGTNNAFDITLEGGGRYDLLDDMTFPVGKGDGRLGFYITANSSFYSNGHHIMTERGISIAGGGTANTVVDLTGSTLYLNTQLYAVANNGSDIVIDGKRTLITTGSTFILGNNKQGTDNKTGLYVTNNSGADLHFNNVYFNESTGEVLSGTSSSANAGIVFNKVVFAHHSALTENAVIVADTLVFGSATVNTVDGGKKIVVNKKLTAFGSPCGTIEIKSSNTTPAVLGSGNCDMMVNFGKLSYITADISGACSASGYKLIGKASEQTAIGNWTLTDIDGGGSSSLLGADTTMHCAALPYIQKTKSLGAADKYLWEYRADGASVWTACGSGKDTIHVTRPGYYRLRVEYSATCNLTDIVRHFAVIDNIPPVVTLNTAANATVAVNNENCTYLVTGTAFDAVISENPDDCDMNPGISEVWYTLSGATNRGKTVANTLDGQILEAGITTVTWFASDNPFPVSNVASGSFTVTVTGGNITVYPIEGVAAVSVGGTNLLTNPTPGGVWKSADKNIATVDANGLVAGISEGTAEIWYVVKNAYGCADSASLNITVHPYPVFAFADVASCSSVDLTALTPVSGNITGLAMTYYLDGSSIELANTTVGAGTYKIVGTNANGLSASSTFKVVTSMNPGAPTNVLYVKQNGAGDGTGRDWDNAFDGHFLAQYLRNVAKAGTKIYVAKGVYYPYFEGCDNVADPRSLSFELKVAVEMYGGFPANATGTTINNANPKANITRLSGDIGVKGDNTDNSYNVVTITARTGTLLDGFYISDGHGVGKNGGGVFAGNSITVTLSNAVVENNTVDYITDADNRKIGGYGAGIHAYDLTLSHITVTNNRAYVNGGGIYVNNTLTMDNVTISRNVADGSGAGVVANKTMILKGDIAIEENTAIAHGGGIYLGNLALTTTGLTSLKIVGNKGVNGGGICCNYSSRDNSVADITIDGRNTSIIISGNIASSGGAINANAQTTLTLKNISIEGNTAMAAAGVGGGINTTGPLTLENVYFSKNTATGNSSAGGALYSGGVLSIKNCTFAENTSATGGGAIVATAAANVIILNSTFSQNRSMGTAASNATNGGGGGAVKAVGTGTVNIALSSFNGNVATNNAGHAIYFESAANKTLNGNIIYGNGTTGTEINTAPATAAHNIIRGIDLPGTDNLNLGDDEAGNIFATVSGNTATLGSNGGFTQTLDIKEGGYAHNFIPNSALKAWGYTTDQRDSQRPFGCKTDAGSVELQVEKPVPVITNNTEACTGDEVLFATESGFATYSWTSAGGTTVGAGDDSTESFTWATGGTKTVMLTVTDGYGCTNTASKNVDIKQRSETGPLYRLPNVQ